MFRRGQSNNLLNQLQRALPFKNAFDEDPLSDPERKDFPVHTGNGSQALSSLLRIWGGMDLKDKVTVWAGLLTLAVLQVQDRVDTELNLYGSGWVGAVVSVVYFAIGFVIVFGVLRWILERYLKGKSQPQPTPPPPFGPPQK